MQICEIWKQRWNGKRKKLGKKVGAVGQSGWLFTCSSCSFCFSCWLYFEAKLEQDQDTIESIWLTRGSILLHLLLHLLNLLILFLLLLLLLLLLFLLFLRLVVVWSLLVVGAAAETQLSQSFWQESQSSSLATLWSQCLSRQKGTCCSFSSSFTFQFWFSCYSCLSTYNYYIFTCITCYTTASDSPVSPGLLAPPASIVLYRGKYYSTSW